MSKNFDAQEFADKLNVWFKKFLKESAYHSGNVFQFLKNVSEVIYRIKMKIFGLLMLGVPGLYFDEGKEIMMNLVNSISSEGFYDIFILFAFGSVIVTWVSFAIYFIFFK